MMKKVILSGLVPEILIADAGVLQLTRRSEGGDVRKNARMMSDNTGACHSIVVAKQGVTAPNSAGMSDKTCYLTLRKGSVRSFPAEYGRRVRLWGEIEGIAASQRQQMQGFFHIGQASDPCRFPDIPLQCRGKSHQSHLAFFQPTAHLLSRDDFDAAFSALSERAMPQRRRFQERVVAKSHSSPWEMPQNRAEPGVDGPSPSLKLHKEPVETGEAMTCGEVLIDHCVLPHARRDPELVSRQPHNVGYNLFSLILASSLVKRQSTFASIS
ncbi:MAG: hypothetical protein KKH67_07910, partial [candidate division Zixibacteria bacterium]|nr:hypothetical protein [candidate division Zixibacteria bacterium]